ncbi:hypothetical protein [Segatella copri]|uniref:hypothetical protein n=1 Tax=Segatella copri TaxID=165179 RepID=UPI001C48CCA1|nr:hypothetical protein [Segatella copri]MBW0024254.1 hypothetical protein [Segatella copri]
MDIEYIPGDLVMVKESALRFAKDKIFKVISSLSGGFVKVVMLNDSSTTYSISNNAVRPIPLTPEILEKNGWVKDKEGYINDSYHLHLCGKYDGYSVYKVVNDNVVWLTGVRNVSDLQHLFFGLGINHEMEV